MKKKNAPTPEQCELFRLCVAEYANLLNLRDWRIEVGSKPAQKGAMADVQISMEDRMAIVSLGSDWGPKPITNEAIRETAVHEVLHIFMRPLMEACASRDASQVDTQEHSVIVILEKLLAA